MKITTGRKQALLITALLFFLATQITANDPFYDLSDLRPKMKGYGLTVFSGTKVESFPIEIVGVMRGSGAVARLVLIKLTGGQTVAAGMSGSPIFVNEKLIGAIGYGFQNADARYAVVTPIEEMLTLWERKEEAFGYFRGSIPGYQGVIIGAEAPDSNWLEAQPVATPLFLVGYGDRAGRYLLTTLQQDGFFSEGTVPMLSPTLLPLALAAEEPRKASSNKTLQPGSAVTVNLVEGDYEVTALGTLTWREGDEFLAFGHSFLNKGWVEYGVGSAEILGVIDSREFPFKLGTASSCIGRVVQDRGAGVAGEFGVLPQMVKVTTEVMDEASGLVRNYAFSVVNDEELLPGLVISGIMDTIDRTLDRIGSGTAEVYFELTGENFPHFQRDNLFYGRDVAAVALKEVGEILRVITENEFIHPQITGVKVRVKVKPGQLNARISKAELPKEKFTPGEKVTLTINLFPYRGEMVQIPLEIEIPATPGKWLLMVYGNEFSFATEEQSENEEELYTPELYQSYTSLEEKLADYRKRPQNNRIMVEFIPAEGIPEELGREDEKRAEEGENPATADRFQTVSTAYYVTGEEQLLIEVVDPQAEENPKLPTIGPTIQPTIEAAEF